MYGLRFLKIFNVHIDKVHVSLDLETYFPKLSLKSIPDCSGLNSLEQLDISECSNLEMLPEMPCNIVDLWLCGTAIEELPLSFGNLSRMRRLFLAGCKRLKSLPNIICKLESLRRLDIDGCSKLNQLPNDIGTLESLEVYHNAKLHYPGSEIPKCFDFRSVGSVINVELSPNWFNNNFLGFAFCIVVTGYPIDFKEKYCSIRWKCNFKSKDGQDQCVSHQTGTYVYSNHVFVTFFSLPRVLCENVLSFEFHLNSSSLKIKKCGVHLIFDEEVHGSSLDGEDEDVLSFANDHDNCEEKIEGDTQLIKMVKALSVLSLTLQAYLKEVFLLDSVVDSKHNNIDLKLLIDIFNGITNRKQQLNEAPKKNLSTKVSVVAEEDLDAVYEEGFLHNHEECIKAHTKAIDIDEFPKKFGLKNNDFPMEQSASSSQVAMDDLLSEDEFPWKREEFIDHDSPPPSPKSPNHFMMWEDTVDDIDIMSFESPNFTLIKSP
ncbi:hypothetical protein Ddye_013812 [Dipteronia dyeriana]|uniref:Leucine-rich repeat domain, L domain-containing protein n=1 Tax=Dipteronia dyeriana TaxID=168575 RepID=A0AAD9X6T4_9ROSI|nr:hypothetical protein Ddye_013812 [Dipteronia dyeriana]